MSVLLLFVRLISVVPTMEARYTPDPPRIDGVLDDVWQRANSSSDFTQMAPDEGKPISFKTTVYLLYDDENLYVAFKCLGDEVKAYLGPWDSGEGDGVGVFLDTFGDRRTGYGFRVNAMGVQTDFVLSNDGRSKDFSWDSAWFANSKVYHWGYLVEIRIPFKSLRYKKGLDEWGINFSRYINKESELAYWAPMKRTEELRISRFGRLKGIHPKVEGRFLEVYPVGLLRYDRYQDEPGRTNPHMGIDLTWSPSPQEFLHVTFNPDFGEIESDPFTLNLSKYRLYFPERRPFFVEGQDLFRVFPQSGFNIGPFVRLFYSRNVGRRLTSGEEVPISLGSKFIHKTEGFEGGILLLRTEPEASEGDAEPLSYFAVLRSKWAFRGNSTIGLIFCQKEQPWSHHVRMLSGDLFLRTTSSEIQLVAAGSDIDRRLGRFVRGKMNYSGERWFGGLDVTYIEREFEINEIGYVPLPGQANVGFFVGPHYYPEEGIFRSFFFGVGGGIFKEFEEGVWEKAIVFAINPVFRNRWGMSTNLNLGKAFEQGTHFTSKALHLNFWSDWTQDLQGWGYLSAQYGYNYHLGFFAWHLSQYGGISYSLSPSFSLSTSIENTIELNPDNLLEEMTTVLRPRLAWSVTRNLHINVYQEVVRIRSLGRIRRIRLGGLFSFQLGPKSWFYLAFNDLESRESDRFAPEERVSLLKIRYLFLF